MYKKVLALFLLTLISVSVSYAYEYNASWTDLEVINEGWCTNLEVPFLVYNKTEYDDNDFEEDLCRGNETAEDDDCNEYETISGTVKIYNGPFDNEEAILLDQSLSSSSFSYTFTKEGIYLVEVLPSGNYNDWYNTDFYVEECGVGNNNEEETNETIENETEEVGEVLEDQSFYYEETQTTLDLTSSGLNSSEDLTVKTYNDPGTAGLTGLLNTIKVIQVIGEENYSALTITSTLDNIASGNSNFKVYKYDTVSSSWNEIGNGLVQGNNVVISSADLGIYAVTEEQQEIIEEVVQEPVIEETQISENVELPSPAVQSSSGSSNTLIYSLIGLLVLVLALVMFSKRKKKHVDEKKEETTEHVMSYAEIMKKTQDYVTQYKKEYSKDQIYRALKEAKVPKDIIDKVFAIEY